VSSSAFLGRFYLNVCFLANLLVSRDNSFLRFGLIEKMRQPSVFRKRHVLVMRTMLFMVRTSWNVWYIRCRVLLSKFYWLAGLFTPVILAFWRGGRM